MQNNHDELYYLIDLVRLNLLGDIRQFRNEVSRPINYARAKDAKNEIMKLAEEQENLLCDLIRPAFIERKKEDVLKDSLTKKNEKVIFCGEYLRFVIVTFPLTFRLTPCHNHFLYFRIVDGTKEDLLSHSISS